MAEDLDGLKLGDLTVELLKRELGKRKIGQTGPKVILIKRLKKALVDEGEDPENFRFSRKQSDSGENSQQTSNEDEGKDTSEKEELNTSDMNNESDNLETTESFEEKQSTQEGKGEDNPEECPTEKDNSKENSPKEVDKPVKTDNKRDVLIDLSEMGLTDELDFDLKASMELSLEENQAHYEDQVDYEVESQPDFDMEDDDIKSKSKSCSDLRESKGAAGGRNTRGTKYEDGDSNEKDMMEWGDKSKTSKKTSSAEVSSHSEEKSENSSAEKASEDKDGPRDLWVSGLSTGVKASDLKSTFIKHGKVISAKIVTNRKAPDGRCFGLITVASMADAEHCVKELHSTELLSRVISVKIVPKKKDTPKSTEEPNQSESKLNDEKDTPPKKIPIKKRLGEKIIPKEEYDRSRDRERRMSPRLGNHPNFNRGERFNKWKKPVFDSRANMFNRKRREREMWKAERMRQEEEEIRRMREMKHRHEAIELEREREKLRMERDKIEREKADLLRLERERLEREREELKRQQEQMKVEEARRMKRRALEEFESRKRPDRQRFSSDRAMHFDRSRSPNRQPDLQPSFTPPASKGERSSPKQEGEKRKERYEHSSRSARKQFSPERKERYIERERREDVPRAKDLSRVSHNSRERYDSKGDHRYSGQDNWNESSVGSYQHHDASMDALRKQPHYQSGASTGQHQPIDMWTSSPRPGSHQDNSWWSSSSGTGMRGGMRGGVGNASRGGGRGRGALNYVPIVDSQNYDAQPPPFKVFRRHPVHRPIHSPSSDRQTNIPGYWHENSSSF